MKYGLHNALTAYYIKGWKSWFSWLIHPFCKCQNTHSLTNQDVWLADFQVALDKENNWRSSHGAVWYNARLITVLQFMRAWCIANDRKLYLRLGYDNHWGCTVDHEAFEQLINFIKNNFGKYIILYESYIEKPWKVTTYKEMSVFERYWSIGWAKEMTKKHWWNFYLFLPIPWLWAKLYKKQWLKEFKESGKEIFMTDFAY